MDCEKFDRVVLDLLYAELDELTSAAAKRHVEHCMRCRRIDAGLRATREVGVLPAIEPPFDLEQRILDAERRAHAVLPLRQRMGRAISIMAGYAMRPQLAMVALLLLMIGGSLLLLRARPGDRDSVRVTERGVPEGEGESVAIVPLPEKAPGSDTGRAAQAHGALQEEGKTEARRERRSDSEDDSRQRPLASEDPAAGAAPITALDTGDAGDLAYDDAMAAFNDGRYAEAQRRFEEIANAGGAKSAAAALFAAQSARNGAGCSVAAGRFEQVTNRFPGTPVGNEAAWQAADCFRALGQFDAARRHYRALLATQYASRAQLALAELDRDSTGSIASRRARPASKAASEPPASGPPAAAPPAKLKPSQSTDKQSF